MDLTIVFGAVTDPPTILDLEVAEIEIMMMDLSEIVLEEMAEADFVEDAVGEDLVEDVGQSVANVKSQSAKLASQAEDIKNKLK